MITSNQTDQPITPDSSLEPVALTPQTAINRPTIPSYVSSEKAGPTAGVPQRAAEWAGTPSIPAVEWAGTPGTPSTPGTTSVPEPVHPVNQPNNANLAGLPLEGVPVMQRVGGVSLRPTAITFKLPAGLAESLDQESTRLNELLPPDQPRYNRHRYGVEILSRHMQFNALQQQATYLGERLQLVEQESAQMRSALVQELTQTRSALVQERHKSADLTAQLQQASDAINRLEHPPTPTQPAPPVPPAAAVPVDRANSVAHVAQVEARWTQTHGQLQTQFMQLKETHQQQERAYQELTARVKRLPELIGVLCREAARNSWYTTEYYEAYFNQFLPPLSLH